jgi:transcriptional regulator with XRE-family HTH domain
VNRIYPDLKAFLDDTGMTQAAFAEKVGASQSVISRIVNKQIVPDVALALRISKEARVPLESLTNQSEVA